MTVSTQIRCRECDHRFWWEHERRGETPPDDLECPRCNGEEPIPIPFRGAPALLLSSKAKSVDKMYRDLETSSAERASMAAEMGDMTDAEVAHMKVTDMKDHIREGDTTAVPAPVTQPQNPVTAQMAALNQRNETAGAPPAAGFVPGIDGIPHQPSGEGRQAVKQAFDTVRNFHETQGSQFIASGNQGRHVEKR